MRNYQDEFQQLVNDAINDGWVPIWIDRVEGNDCEIERGEDASHSVYFLSPDEQKGWDE